MEQHTSSDTPSADRTPAKPTGAAARYPFAVIVLAVVAFALVALFAAWYVFPGR